MNYSSEAKAGDNLAHRVQLREVAERAGVSISTASRVLSNKAESVNSDLVQKVRLAVAEIRQEYDKVQRIKEQIKLQQVGLFLTDTSISSITYPFYPEIVMGIEAECKKQGIHLSLTTVLQTADNINFIRDKINQNKLDGLIFLSFDNPDFLLKIQQIGLPMVLVNAIHSELALDAYLPNNWMGATLAMRHLLQQGHRRILHINSLHRWTLRRRHDAYRAALEEAGISYNPALLLQVPALTADTTYEVARNFLENHPPDFTAAFCANDDTAMAFIRNLKEIGLRVPQDISVVGFDNIPMTDYFDPPLTTIQIERREVGTQAVRGLINRAAMPDSAQITVEVACRLIERSSVMPPQVISVSNLKVRT